MAPPRKHPPGTTAAERLRLSRATRRASGAIAASVEIDEETVAYYAQITAVTGETRKAAVARLAREEAERLR